MTAAGRSPVVLRVGDRALVGLIATAAAATPGVARLQPTLVAAAQQAATRLVRQATGDGRAATGTPSAAGIPAAGTPAADRGAVELHHLDRDVTPGRFLATVRIVAVTEPPVVDTVRALQQRVVAEVQRLAGVTVDVTVAVVDIEPPGPAGRSPV